MYIYESHMGGLYSTENQLTIEEQHCDCCGDYDWYVCEVNSDTPIEEVVKIIMLRCGICLCEWVDNCNLDCHNCGLHFFSGGYVKESIQEILSEFYSEKEITDCFDELTKRMMSKGPKTEEEWESMFGED